METRVALIGIIVEQESSAAALNALLHEYGGYIIGRMGLPYRERGVNIISVVLDAPQDKIAALARSVFLEPGCLPLVLVTDGPLHAVYAAAGYRVGGVQLAETVLRQAKEGLR